MTKQEILNYLNKPCDFGLVDEIYIYLRNDRKICNSMNRMLAEFAERKIKQKCFDKVLFIQAVKLEIDKWLSTDYFKKEYGEYISSKVDSTTKYHVAWLIAKYILYDFYRISL